MRRDEDRCLVVRAGENRAPAELATDRGETRDELIFGLGARRREDEVSVEVARGCRWSRRVLGHGVHRHADATERPDRSDTPVVDRVLADLEEEHWHRTVEVGGRWSHRGRYLTRRLASRRRGTVALLAKIRT